MPAKCRRSSQGRLLAAHGTHANALINRKAAGLDDAFFQAPAFGARVLKVQVRVIDPVRCNEAQCLQDLRLAQAEGLQQQGLGRGQAFKGRLA